MDDLYAQIDRTLLTLNSETRLHEALELVTSIKPTWEHVRDQVMTAAKLSTPDGALFLVKFVFLLGKKDVKFFKAIDSRTPEIILYCYQVARDKESTRLYVTSWLMNSQWKRVAETSICLIQSFDKHEALRNIVEDLRRTKLEMDALDIKTVTTRLDCVVSALNRLS